MGISLTCASGESAYLDFSERNAAETCREPALRRSSIDGADDDQVLEMLSDENRTARIEYVTSIYVRGDVAGGLE